MGSQTWTYAIVFYFLFIIAFLGVLSQGGMLTDTDIVFETNPQVHTTSFNDSYSTDSPPSTSAWSFGEYLSVLFGFFVWGLDLGIGAWMWIIRLFFVYLPGLALLLSIYYSLPTVSG